MFHPGKRFELFWLASLPSLITLLFALFFMSAKHIGGLDRFMPVLPLIPVFYWGMVRTRDIPYWFLFTLGVVIDAVSGLPLGMTALTYLFFLIALHTQRKYIHKEGFVIKLGFFAIILATADLFNWLALCAFYSRFEPVGAVFIQWLLTVCCYPFLHKGFDGIYHYTQSRRWQISHGR
jgi:rod shape-determining protein MreD